MRSIGILAGAALLGVSFAAPARSATSAKRTLSPARPLAWQDLSGSRFDAAGIAASSATVLVFGSTTCPCADGYNSRLQKLAEEFSPNGARFFMVFSAPKLTRTEVENYARSRRLAFPAVHDASGALARRFKVAATPTAVLLRPDGSVAYQGRIDDSPEPLTVRQQYLRDGIAAVLARGRVARASTVAVGCSLLGKKDEAFAGPVKLAEGIGKVEFPITTANPEAQRYFTQGMARWFGFNFPEAERSFREVLRRDPNCAMGHWGIALTLGMNYNQDYDPARLAEAAEASRKAVALCDKTTAREQALIRTLALRSDVPDHKQRLDAYREEMARVYNAHRDDANIAVLYAASIMDLRPWALWTSDGRPQPGAMEAMLVLEDVLRRSPNHIGAHHYYIHLTEASPQPERALASAKKLAELAPQSGHLVHMPAHTYIRVGDFLNAAASNNRAASIDRAYFAAEGKATRYAGYFVHNIDFLIASYLMDGRSADAMGAARDLAEVTGKLTPEEMPLWCGSASGVISVYARCARWDDILKSAAPAEANPFATALWRYARGMAYVSRRDVKAAEQELKALEPVAAIAEKAVPEILVPGFTQAFRKSYALTVPVLAGKIALAKGDGEGALRHFRQAVQLEDSMPYFEPATWRYPVREALGGALLKLGRPAEAEQAFREDLERNRKNGRSLFGLMHALERQGKKDEAARVRAQYQEAWQRADLRLVPEDL